MKEYRLTIISGNNVGKALVIESFPITLGRSSKNDFSIADEILSRHHCSIDERNNELWITDLASANGTAVNGKFIDEVKLNVGDIIQIGDTSIKLTNANENATVSGNAIQKEIPTIVPNNAPVIEPLTGDKIDLGLNSSITPEEKSEKRKTDLKNIRNLAIISVVTIIVISAIMTFLTSYSGKEEKTKKPNKKELDPIPQSLEFYYSETKGTDSNIFKYTLKLSKDGVLTATIDDIAASRHIERTSEKPIKEELILNLKERINELEFSSLEEEYRDKNKHNEWNETIITTIDDKNVKTVSVLNTNYPQIFEDTRNELRNFANIELNLSSIDYSKEELELLAQKSLTLANKCFNEKEIAPENLFNSIRYYTETMYHLENISPKPEMYNVAFEKKREAEGVLNQIIKDKEYAIQRAKGMSDWGTAAENLRELCEIIPDKNDDRHIEYYRQLLLVEEHINKKL